jgi:hypothetical protein
LVHRQPKTVLNSSFRLSNIAIFSSKSPDDLILNSNFIFTERMGDSQPNNLGATETQTIPGDVTGDRSQIVSASKLSNLR